MNEEIMKAAISALLGGGLMKAYDLIKKHRAANKKGLKEDLLRHIKHLEKDNEELKQKVDELTRMLMDSIKKQAAYEARLEAYIKKSDN